MSTGEATDSGVRVRPDGLRPLRFDAGRRSTRGARRTSRNASRCGVRTDRHPIRDRRPRGESPRSRDPDRIESRSSSQARRATYFQFEPLRCGSSSRGAAHVEAAPSRPTSSARCSTSAALRPVRPPRGTLGTSRDLGRDREPDRPRARPRRRGRLAVVRPPSRARPRSHRGGLRPRRIEPRRVDSLEDFSPHGATVARSSGLPRDALREESRTSSVRVSYGGRPRRRRLDAALVVGPTWRRRRRPRVRERAAPGDAVLDAGSTTRSIAPTSPLAQKRRPWRACRLDLERVAACRSSGDPVRARRQRAQARRRQCSRASTPDAQRFTSPSERQHPPEARDAREHLREDVRPPRAPPRGARVLVIALIAVSILIRSCSTESVVRSQDQIDTILGGRFTGKSRDIGIDWSDS